jgi:pimeloyl-[acyl-carrier protein] synthase
VAADEFAPGRFDPFAQDAQADPYPLYERMRAEYPVHFEPGHGVWFLSRYADVEALLKDARFSVAASRPFDRSLLSLDPPDHTRIRALVNRAFLPRVVERMRPRIAGIVDELLEPARKSGRLDLIGDLAYHLPVRVITELLGISADDRARFRGWCSVMVASVDPTRFPAIHEDFATADTRLRRYVSEIARERRSQPRDDLLSALVRVQDEAGSRLTDAELIALCVLLLLAGHDTTVNLIGNGMCALLAHPDELAALHADPALISAVIEELLRFDSPVQATGRIATEPVEINGVTIRSGQLVYALLGAANRDPHEFARPDAFDICRTSNRHIAFGRGIHYCLGAPLARLEAEIAIGALISEFPHLHPVSQPKRRPTTVLRGFSSIPLALA